ncbi:hypothetical protein ACQ4WX_28190 [Streptomyces lasalocidi]
MPCWLTCHCPAGRWAVKELGSSRWNWSEFGPHEQEPPLAEE